MGDLASKRNARDLWISKGHLGAAAVLCLALTCGAYALGFMMGQSNAQTAGEANNRLVGEQEGVVDLLDRIEGSAADPEGQHTLTFPKVLVDEDAERDAALERGTTTAAASIVAPGKVNGPVVVVGQIQNGGIALKMALNQMGQGMLVGRRVEGDVQTVTIAGFETLAEAQRHLSTLQNEYPDLEALYEIRSQ